MKCSVLVFLGVFLTGVVSAESLEFSKRVFTGTYSYNGSLNIEEILLTGDAPENATVELSKNGSEEFKVPQNPNTDGTIPFYLSEETLFPATLDNEVVILEITATNGNLTAYATIFVLLPNARSPFFRFPKRVFQIDSSIINELVTVDSDIVTIDGNFHNVVLNLGGDYKDSLQCSLGNDGEVTLTGTLDDEVLANNHIVVTVAAAGSGSTVTDNADVVIALPSTQKVTPLHFLDTLYYFEYSEETSSTGILTTDTDIYVRAENLTADARIAIMPDTFDATFSPATGKVTLFLTGTTLPITANNQKVTITVTNGEETATVNVFVKLPSGQNKTPLHFKSSVFTGKYTAGEGLTISGKIAVVAEDVTDVELTLDAASGEIFQEPILDTDTGEIALALKDLSQWTPTGNQFTVKITATAGKEVATSDVIIQLPDTQKTELLHFATNIYTAEYTEVDDAGLITLDPGQIITLNSATNAQLQISDDAHFRAEVDQSGVVTLTLAADLPVLSSEFQEGRKEIIVTLTATESDFAVTADVVVKLNINTPPSSRFTKNVFLASLTEGTIELHDEIRVRPSDSDASILIAVEGVYSEYLNFVQGPTNILLVITKSVPEEILRQNEIIVEISAIIEGEVDAEFADVVVTLPKPPNAVALHFNNNFYTADYYIDSTGRGTVTVVIDLLGGTGATVTLDSESAEYLEPNLTNGVVTIAVRDDKIPDQYLQNKNHIVAQLTATLSEQKVTVDIAVKLPKEEVVIPLHFNDNSYIASLDDGIVTISDIVLKGRDFSKIDVNLEGEHSNLFEATLLPEANPELLGTAVEITVVQDEEIPNDNEIVLTLTAFNTDDLEDPVTSDIIVKLPKEPVRIPIHFSSNVYFTEYSPSIGLTFISSEIEFIGDTDVAVIDVDAVNRDYFKVTPSSGGSVTLEVIGNITAEDFTIGANNLIRIVKVTATDGTETVTSDVIVVALDVTPVPPHFSSKVYVAEHGVDDNGNVSVTFTAGDVTIEGDEPHKLKIEDDKKLFDGVVRETGQVELKWVGAEDVLKSEEDIVVVKLTASDDVGKKEEATLYVVLEKVIVEGNSTEENSTEKNGTEEATTADAMTKEATTKVATTKEATTKRTTTKVATTKEATTKESTTKRTTTEVATTKEATTKEAATTGDTTKEVTIPKTTTAPSETTTKKNSAFDHSALTAVPLMMTMIWVLLA